jgi:hypothetical protein
LRGKLLTGCTRGSILDGREKEELRERDRENGRHGRTRAGEEGKPLHV